ncbi:MAG: fluoride efflux transporter CrcB [Burkholderiales bacterium]
MGPGFVAVGIGAALGAWLRWWLGIWFNAAAPNLPLGTLIANVIGGYLIGIAVQYFSTKSDLPPEARLFIVTGFLGGLTTFSTFSAEAVGLLTRGEYSWAFAHIGSHLAGSLIATLLGIATMRFLQAV